MATLTRRYTNEAVAFAQRHRDRPFFLYPAHAMPHTRPVAPAPFRVRSKRVLYGDVVEELDLHTGRLLDALKETGLAERTHVLFTSDNGPWLIKNKDGQDGHLLTDHGGSAGPLRGAEVSTFGGGLRVPTLLWGPGRVPAGKTCDALPSTLDILPTFAAVGAPRSRATASSTATTSGICSTAGSRVPTRTRLFPLSARASAGRAAGRWQLHLEREADPVGVSPSSVHRHLAPANRAGSQPPRLADLPSDPGDKTDGAIIIRTWCNDCWSTSARAARHRCPTKSQAVQTGRTGPVARGFHTDHRRNGATPIRFCRSCDDAKPPRGGAARGVTSSERAGSRSPGLGSRPGPGLMLLSRRQWLLRTTTAAAGMPAADVPVAGPQPGDGGLRERRNQIPAPSDPSRWPGFHHELQVWREQRRCKLNCSAAWHELPGSRGRSAFACTASSR